MQLFEPLFCSFLSDRTVNISLIDLPLQLVHTKITTGNGFTCAQWPLAAPPPCGLPLAQQKWMGTSRKIENGVKL
jgi:hypothetical protein